MKRTFIRLGDSLLGLVLPTGEAGACVPENGQYCGCNQISPGVYRAFYINCQGSCTAKSYAC